MTKIDELLNSKNLAKLRTIINQEEEEVISFNSLKNMLIEEVHKQKGKELFGIFHKFGTIITTKEGDIMTAELVDLFASTLADKGFVVIAGNFIYEKENDKILKTDTTIKSIKKTIKNHSEKDHLFKISECLASLPSYAIFILLNEDSASQHEARVFHSEEKKHPSKLAIGLHFVEDLPLNGCGYLIKRVSKKGISFCICDSEDFNNQCKNKKKCCFFTEQARLSASHVQLFINNSYSKLIILDQHNNADKVVLELI